MCGVLVFVSGRSGVHVWYRVGLEVLRRILPSTAATVRISQMHVRILCTSRKMSLINALDILMKSCRF